MQAVNESGAPDGGGGGFQVWTAAAQETATAMEVGAAHLNEDDICWKPKRGTSFREEDGGIRAVTTITEEDMLGHMSRKTWLGEFCSCCSLPLLR